MKCPNCGANLEKGAKFCPNCGNSINISNNSPSSSNIVDTVLSRPKLVIVALIVVIVIFAMLIFTSNGDSSNQKFSSDGGYDVEIFGVAFHIPEGFKESYHTGPFSNGETVDFESDDYDDLEIDVSPYRNVNLNSNHVKVKSSKNIDGMDGTIVFYDSNRVSFYYRYGDYLIKLNTNSPDYEELFSSVII